METRQITEYKVYVLNLAEMHGGVDKSRPVAVFDDIEKLKTYYNSQLAEQPYSDEDNYGYKWHKVFKKGSLLEWYNPLSPVNQHNGDEFKIVSWHDAAFGGVTENWVDTLAFSVPFNP